MTFSVIIPTHNRRASLAKSLEILLMQEFDDFEIIIVDDGSTDDTGEFLKTIASTKVRCISQENSGVTTARNEGAFISRGAYLIFLDDDDEVSSRWLVDFSDLLSKQPKPDILYCGICIKDIGANLVRYYRPDSELWRFVLSGCWAVRREVFHQVGGYDTRLKFGENTELFMRFGQIPHIISFTIEINFTYNISGTGGGRNPQNIIASNLLILNKHKTFFKRQKSLAGIYNRIAGVNSLKLGKKAAARSFFLKAIRCNPFDLKTSLRFLMTFI
jgi:glycosyltransferase involved in cell wall biosynthesis